MDTLLEIFSFQGRANRAWYIKHILIDDFIIISLMITLVVVGTLVGAPWVVLPILGVIFGGLMAAVAVTVKRLHDLDRPGWHWFLLAIPLYNLYLGFKLIFAPGTVGMNRFGPDPLGPRRELGPGPEPRLDAGFLEK